MDVIEKSFDRVSVNGFGPKVYQDLKFWFKNHITEFLFSNPVHFCVIRFIHTDMLFLTEGGLKYGLKFLKFS